jgi:hypothetical protein
MVYARDWDIPLCLLHGPATAYGLPSMVSTEDSGDCPASPASRLTRFEILARVIGRRFRRSGVVQTKGADFLRLLPHLVMLRLSSINYG